MFARRIGMWAVVAAYMCVADATAQDSQVASPTKPESFERSLTGILGSSDKKQQDGQYYDEYTVRVVPGAFVRVKLESADFDPVLILTSPTGETHKNDDDRYSMSRSRIEIESAPGGEWTFQVTSAAVRATGTYTMTALQAARRPPDPPGDYTETFEGRLVRVPDEPVAAAMHTLSMQAGDRIFGKVVSDDFVPQISAETVGRTELEGVTRPNGTFDVLAKAADGVILVVTSQDGKLGAYRLHVAYEKAPSSGFAVEYPEFGPGVAAIVEQAGSKFDALTGPRNESVTGSPWWQGRIILPGARQCKITKFGPLYTYECDFSTSDRIDRIRPTFDTWSRELRSLLKADWTFSTKAPTGGTGKYVESLTATKGNTSVHLGLVGFGSGYQLRFHVETMAR